ncbi:MAG: tetratricopeptide repeat protein [Bradymonadia bacterium]
MRHIPNPLISWTLALALGCPAGAWAQEAPVGDARESSTLTAAELDQAEAAFFKGLAAYRAGKFDEAVQGFQEAYQLSKQRDMLFNLGRSFEGRGDKAAAIKAYRTYLATKPVDETAVMQRIRQLGGDPTPLVPKADTGKKGQQPTVFGTPGITPEEKNNTWPWVLVGVGAVGIGVGTVLGLQALSDADAARSESSRSEAESLKDSAESGALLADVTLGVGIAALGAGLVWLLLDDEPDEGEPRVEVQATGSHFGIGISGSF